MDNTALVPSVFRRSKVIKEKKQGVVPHTMGGADVEITSCSKSFYKTWIGWQKRALNESKDGRKPPVVRKVKVSLFCLEQDYQ